MPRRSTPFIPDMYYHFYNRGNNRQAVFFEPANYLYFLHGIKKYVFPMVDVIAYCLMPTHYHILVRVKDVQATKIPVSRQVSLGMQKLLISYSKAINKRFSRTGALFQGQFQAKPIQDYPHLLGVCIYIHANPVKDGLVHDVEDWPYSNYLEWIGKRNGSLYDPGFIGEHFGSGAEYQKLVLDHVRTRYIPEELQEYLRAFE